MRSDAVRNREAILTSAIGVLADRPTASMREIAVASGTGRTTLYRHFPDRQALVLAIFDRVIDEANGLTARALAARPSADPVEVVADLSVELAELGDRYRFLQQDLPWAGRTIESEERARRATPLRRYLRDGQRDGRIRSDLDADWLLDAVVALISQAALRTHRRPAAPRVQLRRTIQSILAVPDPRAAGEVRS
jgi:AcrR family transcriptional regulator